MMLPNSFFEADASVVAQQLLGKIIRKKYKDKWLAARIIETEAYYRNEKGSHSSLGLTAKRKALFMPPGTIYMYYARGKDSFNISCAGDGNAVLIKSAHYFTDSLCHQNSLQIMQQLNPSTDDSVRPLNKLCAGQTLLCQSLNLKVTDWDQQSFDAEQLWIDDIAYQPESIIQSPRLGIPPGRDEHLMLRFIDEAYTRHCTSNPLTKRGWLEDKHYKRLHQITSFTPV